MRSFELEAIPPKQKLRILKNAVSEVPELQNIKQIEDQIIAWGGNSLG
jgi:hypothetical protein